MARNYVWLEHLGRPFAIDANDVQAVYADANGNTVLDIVGSDRSFGVCGAVEEVAARLGIPPRPAPPAPPSASDEGAIDRLAKAIQDRRPKARWVSGPGRDPRHVAAYAFSAVAWLEPEFSDEKPDRKPDFAWERGLPIDEDFRRVARWLWSLGYREVVAAPAKEAEPEPEPPIPSRDEQVALLAAGKRLRFVRDAGAMGERVPEAVEAIVHGGTTDEDGDERYHGYVGRPGSELEVSPLFQSEWGIHRVTTARRTLELLSDLGYRFVAVVD